MKYILAMLGCVLTMQAQAAIYICEDAHHNKAYQDTPCATRSVGQLAHVPDASFEDQQRAQQRTQIANAQFTKRMELLEQERQVEFEQQRQYLALEVERKRLAALEAQTLENSQPVYAYWPRTWGSGSRSHPWHGGRHGHKFDRQFDRRDTREGWRAATGYRSQGGSIRIEYRR